MSSSYLGRSKVFSAAIIFLLCAIFGFGSVYRIYAAVSIVNLSTAIVSEVTSSSPEYLATDAAGNVYVSGTGAGYVKKFNSQGDLLLTVGQSGSGDGEFGSPTGLAIDSSGNIFVADKSLNRMQKFDSSGNFLAKWGTSGSGDGQFASGGSMGGVAVDSSGNVYVVDSYNDRVQKFDNNGNFITKWGTNGSGDDNFYFYSPSDIVIDTLGNVYISDSGNNRIKKYTQNGVYVSSFGTSGSGDGQFSTPTGLALDPDGNIYVADYDNSRVQIFNPSFTFIEAWGSSGTGPGEFSNSVDVLYGPLNGLIYVIDYASRIQFFDRGSYSPPAPSPTPTPTPTPTENNSSSGNNSTSESNDEKNRCNKLPPLAAPKLFKASRESGKKYDSVTLWFEPVNDRTDGYTVLYGHKAGDERYAVSFSQGYSSGALSYKIGGLEPKQSYTFWIKSKNDCAAGPQSNYLEAKAIETDLPEVVPTPSPTPTVAPATESVEIVATPSAEVDVDTETNSTLLTVLSSTGLPISGARISLDESNRSDSGRQDADKILGTTDSNGQIEISLPEGEYKIQVEHSGKTSYMPILVSSSGLPLTLKILSDGQVSSIFWQYRSYLLLLLLILLLLLYILFRRKRNSSLSI